MRVGGTKGIVLLPAPVVVDADVLLRNVDYPIRTGRTGARLRQADSNYSLFTGVALFAAAEVGAEAIKHLPDIADRRRVSMEVVHETSNRLVVPNVRFVKLVSASSTDPRVEAVRNLDPSDAHSAELVALLAPAILATDNRKHFSPFALPEAKTDEVAIDLSALADVGLGVRGTLLLPTAAGAVTIEGSKKLAAKIGTDGAFIIAPVLLGALALYMTSDRGRGLRAKLGEIAEEIMCPAYAGNRGGAGRALSTRLG